uniref:Uncharacterized protein n=1 Tax=Oryza punctata TaxID=4537 RepID=A0A0E0M652_ORYPU
MKAGTGWMWSSNPSTYQRRIGSRGRWESVTRGVFFQAEGRRMQVGPPPPGRGEAASNLVLRTVPSTTITLRRVPTRSPRFSSCFKPKERQQPHEVGRPPWVHLLLADGTHPSPALVVDAGRSRRPAIGVDVEKPLPLPHCLLRSGKRGDIEMESVWLYPTKDEIVYKYVIH